jgi:hypothetical protein
VLIGWAVIAYAFGLHILPPWNTGWMLSGMIGPDPVQYWLGWSFFRRAPWSWPPGLNPLWGLEVSSSIYYADAIPLLAFFFKAISPAIEVSQYWGLWIYGCAALQAFMAWRIIGLATDDPLARLAGAALFVLQPTMLARMGGHFALSAHFLLLMGLWLCLTHGAKARWVAWAALLVATALIHAYLLPMVAALWTADVLARWLDGAKRGGLFAEIIIIFALVLAALWAGGMFVLGGGFGGFWGGYGQMQMDVLAPLDPSPWGAFLPDLPGPNHVEVGHSYAGLGALLLVLLGLLAWAKNPTKPKGRFWPLILVLAAMALFAISPNVSIAGFNFTIVELPQWIQRYADALRASERFIWPLGYAALTASIFLLIRWIGGRLAGFMLAGLVVIQVLDMRPGFARLHHFFPPTAATVPLRLSDPFWAEAARHYTRIRIIPSGNQAPWWEEIAVFAATKGLQTDAVYFARLDPKRVAALNAKLARQLAEGEFEPQTLYVLADKGALALAGASHQPGRDLIGGFNGLWVLAPGWHARR